MHWELKDITVWHLERLAPLPDPPPSRPYELVNLVDPDPGFCRYLYATVGAPWLWYEKIGWSLSEWQHHVNQPNLQFWVAYVAGNPIGYFEINHGNDGASEICLFGLMPNWVGKGLGSALLQDAINQNIENVEVELIPTIKFGCGMHTLYSKSFWELVTIPESFGGYGPEDTYGMAASEIAIKLGYDIKQIVLDGIYITEDYIDRTPSFIDKIKPIDKKKEFYEKAHSIGQQEVSSFAKNLIRKNTPNL